MNVGLLGDCRSRVNISPRKSIRVKEWGASVVFTKHVTLKLVEEIREAKQKWEEMGRGERRLALAALQ